MEWTRQDDDESVPVLASTSYPKLLDSRSTRGRGQELTCACAATPLSLAAASTAKLTSTTSLTSDAVLPSYTRVVAPTSEPLGKSEVSLLVSTRLTMHMTRKGCNEGRGSPFTIGAAHHRILVTVCFMSNGSHCRN